MEFLAKRIFSNAIFGWMSKLVIGISGIILTPVLISGLGKYEYSIWVTVGQMAGFLLIADLGIANSIGRLISKYDATGSTMQKNSIYSTALFILLGVMFVIGTFSLIFVNNILDILDIQEQYKEVVVAMSIIMIINISLSFPLRIGRGMLQAVLRFDTIYIILTAAKIIQLIFILGFFYYTHVSLINIALVMSITNILAELILFMKSYSAHNDINFKMHLVNKAATREILSMSGASVLLSSSGALTSQGLIILVSVILGVLYVPIISIPIILLTVIGPFIGGITTTLMPIISGYDSLKDIEKIKKVSIYGNRYILMMGLLIMTYFILYGKDLFYIWLPSNEISLDDIYEMNRIFLLLIFPFVIARSNKTNRSILLSNGSHWLVSNMLAIVSILSFFLAFILISKTSLGVYAVVIAWGAKLLIGDYIFTLFFVLREYSISLSYYIINVYIRPISIAIVAFGILFTIKKILTEIMPNQEPIIYLLLNTSVFLLISVSLFYFFCLEINHRLLLQNIKNKYKSNKEPS